MTNLRKELGLSGEDQAAAYLEKQGLAVIERHFQTRWGEIDLICRHRDNWIFVEVKARTRAARPSALDAVNTTKRKKLVNAALMYMKKHRLEGENMRFDVISIEAGRIEWLPAAYDVPSRYTF